VLKSLYLTLEKVMAEDTPSEVEKSRLLFREIRKFKALKAQIVEGNLALANRIKPSAPQEMRRSGQTATEGSAGDSAASLGGDGQAVVAAIEDLKRFVETEIRQLRDEIKALRPPV
jgi:hypothetical protein